MNGNEGVTFTERVSVKIVSAAYILPTQTVYIISLCGEKINLPVKNYCVFYEIILNLYKKPERPDSVKYRFQVFQLKNI